MAETIVTKYGVSNVIRSLGDCEGCNFNTPSGDCKRPEDFGHRCINPNNIVFVKQECAKEYREDKLYHKHVSVHDSIIDYLMVIKQAGLVRVVPETHRCYGCWFNRNHGCDKSDWMDDPDFPADCEGIIFMIDEEPIHDYPDWNDDDLSEDEVPDSNDIYESKSFILSNGVRLKYKREKYECDGCYFTNRLDGACSEEDVPDHEGWILVEDLPIKYGRGLLAAMEYGNIRKFSLDIGPDSVYKPIPNISLKTEKKFSI
jgi:hypothetical protein